MNGAKPVDQRIGRLRREVFLEQHLRRIGGGLHHAPRSDAVWSGTQLHPCHDLALEEHRICERRDHDEQDDRRLDQRDAPPRDHANASLGGGVELGAADVRNGRRHRRRRTRWPARRHRPSTTPTKPSGAFELDAHDQIAYGGRPAGDTRSIRVAARARRSCAAGRGRQRRARLPAASRDQRCDRSTRVPPPAKMSAATAIRSPSPPGDRSRSSRAPRAPRRNTQHRRTRASLAAAPRRASDEFVGRRDVDAEFGGQRDEHVAVRQRAVGRRVGLPHGATRRRRDRTRARSSRKPARAGKIKMREAAPFRVRNSSLTTTNGTRSSAARTRAAPNGWCSTGFAPKIDSARKFAALGGFEHAVARSSPPATRQQAERLGAARIVRFARHVRTHGRRRAPPSASSDRRNARAELPDRCRPRRPRPGSTPGVIASSSSSESSAAARHERTGRMAAVRHVARAALRHGLADAQVEHRRRLRRRTSDARRSVARLRVPRTFRRTAPATLDADVPRANRDSRRRAPRIVAASRTISSLSRRPPPSTPIGCGTAGCGGARAAPWPTVRSRRPSRSARTRRHGAAAAT